MYEMILMLFWLPSVLGGMLVVIRFGSIWKAVLTATLCLPFTLIGSFIAVGFYESLHNHAIVGNHPFGEMWINYALLFWFWLLPPLMVTFSLCALFDSRMRKSGRREGSACEVEVEKGNAAQVSVWRRLGSYCIAITLFAVLLCGWLSTHIAFDTPTPKVVLAQPKTSQQRLQQLSGVWLRSDGKSLYLDLLTRQMEILWPVEADTSRWAAPFKVVSVSVGNDGRVTVQATPPRGINRKTMVLLQKWNQNSSAFTLVDSGNDLSCVGVLASENRGRWKRFSGN